MKHKVAINVDAELLLAAQEYARSQGVTLSALVERSLVDALSHDRSPHDPLPDDAPTSFAARWRGQFRAAERGDARYDSLAKKYLT